MVQGYEEKHEAWGGRGTKMAEPTLECTGKNWLYKRAPFPVPIKTQSW